MVTAFAIVLVLHGLIHLLGPAKAFGWADLPALTQPISPLVGVLWLVAATLFLASAAALVVWPRWWWLIAAGAVVVSTTAIVPSWADARVGAAANAVVLAGIVFGFAAQGPFSLRAEFRRDAVARVVPTEASPVTEQDLVRLPPPVQRYLRVAGVVGRPRVGTYRATMRGRIRDGRNGRWMPFAAEQYNVVEPASRLFYLTASMMAVPVQGYHRYADGAASMRIRAAAMIPIVDAAGAEMTISETVTLFNDMCLLAPATLIDPRIEWDPIDARSVTGRFTNAGHTIAATLVFNDAGELVDFVSDDRFQSSPDGTPMRRVRWSTPVSGYRAFDGVRLPAGGAGVWHEAEGDYAYIELAFNRVEYNVLPAGPRRD